MTEIWQGAAVKASATDFRAAADLLGVEEALVRALWQVEAGGRGFWEDGSLIRRFEPHAMPGATTTWRDSLRIPRDEREAMFRASYAERPEATLEATSWGGPQIMGFNARAAGFGLASDMVVAMAQSERAQLQAFVTLILNWGLDSALRAHDWLTFARRYNGVGQAEAYARRIEDAYRAESGSASPAVLSFGDRGATVRRLQQALGIEVDGVFGGETDAAVRAFQDEHRLPVDGLVGQRTWAVLKEKAGARPLRQTGTPEAVAEAIEKWGGTATAVTGALAATQRVMPEGAYAFLVYGAVALGLAVVAAALLRRVRSAA